MREHFRVAEQARDLMRRCWLVLAKAIVDDTAIDKERKRLVVELKRMSKFPPPADEDPDWIDKLHSSHPPDR